MAIESAKWMPVPGPISASFSPFFPEERALGRLLGRAAALIAEGHRLGVAASPSLRESLAGLLRARNSYHTNKIEGRQTLPAASGRFAASSMPVGSAPAGSALRSPTWRPSAP